MAPLHHFLDMHFRQTIFSDNQENILSIEVQFSSAAGQEEINNVLGVSPAEAQLSVFVIICLLFYFSLHILIGVLSCYPSSTGAGVRVKVKGF